MNDIKYINIAIEFFGVALSLLVTLCLSLSNQRKERQERLYVRILILNAVQLFSDAMAWVFKGSLDVFSFYAVRIANFCVFCSGYCLLAAFSEYLHYFMAQKGIKIPKHLSYIIWGLSFMGIATVIVSQFNGMYYMIDENNIYHRGAFFWVSQLFGILCMLVNGFLIIRYHRKLARQELIIMSIYIGMPVAAMIVQTFIYGVAVLYAATTISILCGYIGIQADWFRQYSQKELELERSRTAIMLSQIQPHFLFNSLSVVKGLCQTNPKGAEEAVDHFADFLRGNLDSLTNSSPIPFAQELLHTRHYLELEQLRFGERLRIVYNTPVTEFSIPSLTLQPMVENAVKYGILKKEEGGTVVIATAETDSEYLVTVDDDGVGFDAQTLKADNRAHIGISNVRSRMRAQCKGGLSIKSVVGRGTSVVLSIPKEKIS